jgi:type IV pilus assembly protein PilC
MYQFTAYTLDKKIVQGNIDATSENMAEDALYRAGYQSILSLREIRPPLSLATLLPSFFGVKSRDVIDFSHQLATLIESGVSILTALKLLREQSPRAVFRKLIAGLVEELQGGSSFSQALSKYPEVFSYTYRQVVKASEQAGNLEVGLRQVAGYMEKRAVTSSRVKRALAYPVVVILMAIGVFALLITVALPPLVDLFKSYGAELPATTRLLMAGADFIINYKFTLLWGMVILIALTIVYMRLPAGKLTIDRLKLKMPVIGTITTEQNMCHFCQVTSMLMKAGLSLPLIMDIATQTAGNRVIRQALKDVREKLIQGQGLSQPMAASELFPRLMVEMVVVGEKTGTMDSTLATLANYYDERVDQRINTLIAMIEPVLTVVIGLVVAFIALSLITPLYSILSSIK